MPPRQLVDWLRSWSETKTSKFKAGRSGGGRHDQSDSDFDSDEEMAWSSSDDGAAVCRKRRPGVPQLAAPAAWGARLWAWVRPWVRPWVALRPGRAPQRLRRQWQHMVLPSGCAKVAHSTAFDPPGAAADSGCTNMVVLEGPSGAGKTAAVYACAAELGLKVIEDTWAAACWVC